MASKEKNIHLQVCEWIKTHYPEVIFTSDMSGLRVSIGLAIQMKRQRSSNAIPDLIILHPKIVIRDGKSYQYNALLIELKREDERVWLKDNSVTSDPHRAEQFRMLQELNKLGYFATFACGLKEATAIIDDYLKQ
jgi:hypothetical protein